MKKITFVFLVFIFVVSGFLNLGYACKHWEYQKSLTSAHEFSLLHFLSNGLNNKSYSFYFDDVPLPPVAEDQSFCGSAEIGDLNAEGETGAVFSWYSSATGGTALSGTDGITASGTYYVSQTVSGEESDRTAVEITIETIPDAPTADAQSFCGSTEIGDLSAEGETDAVYNWYTSASGGTILSETDEITTSGTYYVSQTVNGCESPRVSVVVTIKPIPPAPVVPETIAICVNETYNDAFAKLELGEGQYLSSYSNDVPPGTMYIRKTVDGCNSEIVSVEVTVLEVPAPTANSQAFCEESTVADLVVEGEDNATFNWYDSEETEEVLEDSEELSGGLYYVSQTVDGCESERTAVFVSISLETTIGTGASTQRYPLGNYYGYEYSAAIYTKEEIGLSGELHSVAWWANTAGQGSRPIKIYLKETYLADLTEVISWTNHISGATLVYDSSMTPVADWNVFELTDSFTYSGNNNLLVLVEANVGGSGSTGSDGNQIRYSTAANKHRYWQDDYDAPIYLNGTVNSNRPNITFSFGESLISCTMPINLSLDEVATDSASISWETDNSVSEEYMLYISEENEAPNFCQLTDVVTQETEFTLDDLESATVYYVWVRSDCGDSGGLSDWIGPLSFMTLCEAVTNLPYTENFDIYGTGSDAFPNCWERPVMYSGYPSIISTYSVSSPNSLRFQSLVGTPTYAVSPAFAEDINNLRVRFQLKREGTSSGTMDVGVMSDPLDITTFELVGTISPADNDFHQYVFNLNETALSGGDNYIAVRQNSASSAWYYWMDNFVVELLPTCLEPGTLTADDITTTEATLGWTSDGDLFDIEIVGAGEDPTGTPTEEGVANPYTVTDLDPSTAYDFYVRRDCGDDDLSAWSGPYTFNTLCDVVTTLPYTENFDVYGTGSDAFPNCWERPVMYSGYPSIVSAYFVSSPNSLRFQSLVGTPTYAVSPAFAEDINNLRVRFQLKREGTSSGTMDVGVMSDPLDITTFELVGTINPADNDFHEYVFNLNETTLSGGGNYIAVRQNSDSSIYYYWLDNFVVELLPACLEPSGVTITHTSEDSVTVSWTAPQEQDSWQVLVLPAGSPAPDENTTGFVETNGNPYIAEGLEPNTEYDIYVRADCGAEDGLSTWTGPAKGITTQIPAELPYEEGFEGENNWTFVGTGDNQWVFGTAVNNGGTHALYVSKDEGTTHTYNTSSTTVAHAYRDFLVEQVSGELEISFDWMANGEGFASTKWDYLNVWLVPSSYNPTPGTLIENTVSNGMLLMYKRNNNTEFLPEFLSIDINSLNAAFDSGYFRIVFEWRNDGGGGDQPPAAIDNLLIKKVTCPPVINLESDIAENGEAGEAQVLLSWTPVGDETQWEIIILPFDDPTVPDENSTGIIVDEPQYLFTVEDDNPGEILCDNKFYKFYVRPLCSEEDWGRWSKQGIVSLIPPPGCAEVEAEIVFSDVEGLTPNAKGDYVICQDEPVNLTLSATYYDIPGTETYEVEAVEYCPPFPFTGGGAIELTVDDEWSEIIDLGFDFCFFGNNYNKVLISTNGIITFSIAGEVEGGRYSPGINTIYYPGQEIPYIPAGNFGSSPTVNSIFGVFQDLDPTQEDIWDEPKSPEDYSINYQIVGKAPCRTLVFNIYHLGLFSCGYDENDVESSTQTSQIVLYEGTNIIEVYVKNRPICMAWGDGKGLIGIQGDTIEDFAVPDGRNSGAWTATEEAWRFSPSGESTAEFLWEKDGEFFSSEPEIEISVNESAKYVARAKYELCGEEFNLTKEFNFLKENFVIGPVEDLIDCSRKPGELNEFDLSSNTALALGDFDADDYTIEYFGSEEDAESGENPLPDVYQRQGGQTIYIKMTNKTTGCYKTKTIKLIKAEPINITQSANLSVCESYTFPVIEPGEAFYTQPYGEGDKYETGDVFSDIGVHKFYIYRVDEHGCFGQSEFELEIVEAPVADIIPDMVLECETFTLPTPSAYNKYYTLADKGGTEIPAGTEIILPSTIYIYAERKGDDGAVCIDQSSFTIDYKDCPIPRGFSPNGDGRNDFYDLDGYGVSSIKIFNRNGVEVYTQGVYKGEWYGQDKSGKALPSGTYYYVIVSNGKTRTGWIQLNR